MFRSFGVVGFVSVVAFAGPAFAQSWMGQVSDNGTFIYGSANVDGDTMNMWCNAPSPQGVPAIETGSHEEETTGPFEFFIPMYEPFFDWSETFEHENVVLYVDDVGYRLPPIRLNELNGTAARVQMSDPLLPALFAASTLVLDTGQGAAYAYPVDGLRAALDQGFSYCATRWMQLGHAMPPVLQPLLTGVAALYHIIGTDDRAGPTWRG